MLNEEFDTHNPHHQIRPATIPLAAQGVRRRPAIPTIQLSKATITSIVLTALAGVTFGVGITRLRGWDAAQMTVVEGQRALADFIATATLAAVFAIVAAVIWGASAIISRIAINRLGLIRGEAALRQQLADAALREEALIAETRSSTRLTWRILHILRQQQRAGRKVRVAPDRAMRDRVEAIERTLKAAAAGAFDPETQANLRSINQELSAH